MTEPMGRVAERGSFRLLTKVKTVAVCLLLLSAASCVRGCTSSRPPIHINPNMDNQPKYLPQEESDFFYNGAAMRAPVEGTLARGELVEDPSFLTGKRGETFVQNPMEITPQLVDRGTRQYEIYCTPCHGPAGDGQGVMTTRAGIQSADLTEQRIRELPDGQIFDVITNGLGLMKGYRYPIRPDDRWAIISYVRLLQREAVEE